MGEMRAFAKYYRPSIRPATENAELDKFHLESGHRLTDDNILV